MGENDDTKTNLVVMVKTCRAEMGGRIKELEARVQNLGVNLAAVKRAVCGETGNPSREPGLLMRFDRVEHGLKYAGRMFWIVVAAVVVQIVVMIVK